jgi:heme ABC exporter ATP-binding subunit CcmA
MTQAIKLRDVVAFAGPFPLLAGVNLTVESGEVVHLGGANGAGKTSLLRCLAGLHPVSQGSIDVLGFDLLIERRSVRSEVGFVSHQTLLYEDLNARDNLDFFLHSSSPTTERVGLALSRVGLEGRLSTTAVSRLSTGQRRRVTLALIFARSPKLLLLDEPHAGLDIDGRGLLDGLIEEMADKGATVLISSHEIDYVKTLVSRTVIMVGGRIPSDDGDQPTKRAEGHTDAHADQLGTEGDHDDS